MPTIHPAALVVFPLVIVAATSRRRAFLFVLGSVPFFNLEVFVALSHPFRLPELALLVFAGHYVASWFVHGRVELRNPRPLLLLWGFVGASALSVIALAVSTPNVTVHPYTGTFLSKRFVDLAISSKNVTQLLLRGLFVLGVTVLAIHLDERRVRTAVRGVILGAVFVGLSGMVYQIVVLLDANGVLELARSFGFRRLHTSPGRLGPIPRMYSTVGEPGFTSDYLLYGFALAASLAVIPGPDWAFRRRELFAVAPFLGVALVLSTGTTGYGGLVIFSAAFVAALAAFPALRPERARWYAGVACGAVFVGVGALFAVMGSTLFDVVVVQFEKMTFQSRSGSIRRFYILRSIDVFRGRPLVGVGVGSHHAPSYLFTLLAETGILGAATLLGGHLWAYRQCVSLAAGAGPPVRRAAAAVGVAGGTLLATNLIAKSISSLLMPWYWFAVAIPIAVVGNWLQSGEREPVATRAGSRTGAESTHS